MLFAAATDLAQPRKVALSRNHFVQRGGLTGVEPGTSRVNAGRSNSRRDKAVRSQHCRHRGGARGAVPITPGVNGSPVYAHSFGGESKTDAEPRLNLPQTGVSCAVVSPS